MKKPLIIAVILIAILVVGGVYFYNNRKRTSIEQQDISLPNEVIPSSWATYEQSFELPDGAKSKPTFAFKYPPELVGTLRDGGGNVGTHNIVPDYTKTDTQTAKLYPSILVSEGLIQSGILGPVHSIYEGFLLGGVDGYSSENDRQKVVDAINAHLSEVNFDTFCDELARGPLEHIKQLKLSGGLRDKLSKLQDGSVKILYGRDYSVVYCRGNRAEQIIEFAVAAIVPETLGGDSKSVELKKVGVIKFFPINPYKYTAVEISVASDSGKNSSKLPTQEVEKIIRLMARSFHTMNP